MLIQLRLPIVSGFTAIRRIRSHRELRAVPIIAVSVNNPTSNSNLALAAGCIAHVEDPGEFYFFQRPLYLVDGSGQFLSWGRRTRWSVADLQDTGRSSLPVVQRLELL